MVKMRDAVAKMRNANALTHVRYTHAIRAIAMCVAYMGLTGASIAATPQCVIIYSDDRPSTLEIRAHELAHCNGWVHEHREDYNRPGYKANQPPAKFIRAYRGELLEFPMSTNEARSKCGGHLGCQWLERAK